MDLAFFLLLTFIFYLCISTWLKAWLLYWSNIYFHGHYSRVAKNKYYDIKERTLNEFGLQTGYVLQHIIKKCWSCEGGVFSEYWSECYNMIVRVTPRTCYKCNGRGVYEEFYIVLLAYNFCGFRFMVPQKKLYKRSEALEYIDPLKQGVPFEEMTGHVKQRKRGRRFLLEVALWFSLLNSKEIFFLLFGKVGYGPIKNWSFYPLGFCSCFYFWWKHKRRFLRDSKKILSNGNCCVAGCENLNAVKVPIPNTLGYSSGYLETYDFCYQHGEQLYNKTKVEQLPELNIYQQFELPF